MLNSAGGKGFGGVWGQEITAALYGRPAVKCRKDCALTVSALWIMPKDRASENHFCVFIAGSEV